MTAEWHRHTFLLILHPFLLILVTQTFPTKLVGARSFDGFVKCQDLSKGRIRENLQSMFRPKLLVDKRFRISTTIFGPSHSVKLYPVTCQNMDFMGPNKWIYTLDMLPVISSCIWFHNEITFCDNTWQLLSITMPIPKLLTFTDLQMQNTRRSIHRSSSSWASNISTTWF